MPLMKDLTGQRFGRFVVVAQDANRCGRVHWLVRCDCGQERSVSTAHLNGGKSRSCGCLQRDRASETKTKHGLTRGRSKPPLWWTWQQMIQRCTNPNNHAWRYYGGRGITVCDRWRNDFLAFVKDVGPKPSAHHSIDRIDNDGCYEPRNVRWATKLEQCLNQRKRSIA